MYQEILAKTLVASISRPDPVFGLSYNLNLYRGCEHQCIYCDSRSECYGIENFSDVLVKINAIELLEQEMRRKRRKGTVGFGSMTDTYTRAELTYELTRKALDVLDRLGFPVHINTKSDLILRDTAVLARIARIHCTVAFSIITVDDALARKLEPGAPPPSARFAAMQALADAGIQVGTNLMPVLPWLTDSPETIQVVMEQTAAHGGSFIIPWFGLSMRDRQREYFYRQLDRHFPGLRQQYERRFGERYECSVPNKTALNQRFTRWIQELHLNVGVPIYTPPQQLTLFKS